MRRAASLGATASLAVLSALSVLAGSEWLNRRWSRLLVQEPIGERDGRGEAVVVLGFRNAGEHANLVNRQRVRSGLRSLSRPGESVLILSGGAPGGGSPEAEVMARYAQELGYAGPLRLEPTSRTTWENVTNVVALLEDAETIKILSQPAHALKARVYLRRLRPDLADRVVHGDDYRVGEWLLLKPLLAAYGLWTLRHLRREIRA